MARPSKVDRLPAELRDQIGRLRESGHTIDEILAKLQELDADVGRTGLGNYIRKFDAIRERIHASRAAAESIVAKLDDAGDDRVARFNIASLHASVMALMAGEDGEPVTLEPKDAKLLTEAVRNLATAAKSDVDRVSVIEKRAAEKARRAAADVAEVAATEAGLDAQRAAELRRKVLGARPRTGA